MKTFSALFLVSLACLSIVSTMKISPIDASMLPSNSIRGELTKMLIEVQQTDSPNTIKQFLKSVMGMLEKLQKEQTAHAKIHKKMMKQCTEEAKFRKSELKNAEEANKKAQAKRADCQASLTRALKDLPELRNAKAQYETELKKAIAQRDAEHKSYLVRKQDLSEGIAFMKQFIGFVGDKLKGRYEFSFIEKTEQVLRHATKLRVMSAAVPVLVALAQAPGDKQGAYKFEANTTGVKKLEVALDKLLKRMEDDYASNEKIEKEQLAKFNTYKAHLEKMIETLKKNIEKLEKQVKEMKACIAAEDKVIKSALAKISRNGGLLDSATKMCKNFNGEFITASKNRFEEIQTVEEILVIIKARFGSLPEDLVKYLEEVKGGWKVYLNSTQFKGYVAYEQKHHKVNVHGKNLATKFSLKFF